METSTRKTHLTTEAGIGMIHLQATVARDCRHDKKLRARHGMNLSLDA